jgi:hypothetical protein
MKEQLKTKLLNIINELEGTGKFATIDKLSFVSPGLFVKSFGEVSFPLQEQQAKELMKISHQAPYGKGHDTIIDTNVRNTWEIDAENISFKNKDWDNVIEKIIKKTKKELGLNQYDVKANFYKMLIYEKDGFFLTHQDSEKEVGMFGTLVINLPSLHKGGALEITFDGETISFNPSNEDLYHLNYTAFYADCKHEIKPVLEGYRITLVYNLIQDEQGKLIELQSEKKYIDKINGLLNETFESPVEKPLIVLLNHQYTTTNFSLERLKLDDRYLADILIKSAKKSNFYANLCLFNAEIIGTPDDYDTSDTMGEVYDENLSLYNWVTKICPELYINNLEKEDLISLSDIFDEEPFETENSGYMGNYGPDLTFTYQYGAIVIWDKVLNAKNIDLNILEWIEYFLTNGNLSQTEKSKIDEIISLGIPFSNYKEKKYDLVFEWAMNINENNLIFNLENDVFDRYFNNSEKETIIKFWDFIKEKEVFYNKFIDKLDTIKIETIIKILPLLSNHLTLSTYFDKIIENLPNWILEHILSNIKLLSNKSLGHLIALEIETKLNENFWNSIVDFLFQKINNEYLREVLIKWLLENDFNSYFYNLLKDNTIKKLKIIISEKPKEPNHWSKSIPETKNNKELWNLIKDFMASPIETNYDHKGYAAQREEIERILKQSNVDLRFETIRKGSPHTLRLIKTHKSYEDDLELWHKDLKYLEKLENNTKHS